MVNEVPKHGGDRVKYYSPGVNTKKTIVFVNGIMNTPDDHAKSCQQIMNATGCQVLGVYNQKGNENAVVLSAAVRNPILAEAIVSDLAQCISDQVGLLARNAGYTGGSINGCTDSLLNLLLEFGARWPSKPLCILAHSQGNLITSNALFMYEALMATKGVGIDDPKMKALIEKGPIRIHVFAVASPAWAWPKPGLTTVHKYYHFLDLVAATSVGNNRRGLINGTTTITGADAGHSLSGYLDDPRLVDSICSKMGTSPRYEVDPIYHFYKDWSYLNSDTRLNKSVKISLANADASLMQMLRR